MLFISAQFFANYAKLTDIQSKVAIIPALQADMTLVKEKLKI